MHTGYSLTHGATQDIQVVLTLSLTIFIDWMEGLLGGERLPG